jgi:membrane protease YdiL (CAAX protease family)
MSSLPEHDPLDPQGFTSRAQEPALPIAAEDSASTEPRPLFESWSLPELVPTTRIPHLGHLCLLAVLALFGWIGTSLLTLSALHFHLYGVSTIEQANSEIHYTLGSQAILYLLAFAACLLLFPLIWSKGFFAGLQWNGATALRLRWRLFQAAFLCFVLAILDGLLFRDNADAPIDKIFRTPGAAWLLFVFGITLAPLCEEIVFRGFLLPGLCTAWDWAIEQRTGKPAPPLGANGHPQWSIFAMIAGSVLTSIPFALMHGKQTGFALGPFLLLVCVSLVLCWARLGTRSLAASTVVHACYNFLIFFFMLIGTGGFRHLDKM